MSDDKNGLGRREFLAKSAAVSAALAASHATSTRAAETPAVLDAKRTFSFDGPDSLFHGHDWQTLNPGYWKVEGSALRRRLTNYGDRARRTGFPFHAETNRFEFKTDYDPSLETGIIYAQQWHLKGEFTISADFTYRADRPDPKEGDDPGWQMYEDGFGVMGLALGSKSLFESYGRILNALQVVWSDDKTLKILGPPKGKRTEQGGVAKGEDNVLASAEAMSLDSGDRCQLTVQVSGSSGQQSTVKATLTANGQTVELSHRLASQRIAGFVGVASRGLIDFEVNEFRVEPGGNQPREIGTADCLACYPLGDTLRQVGDAWTVRFVGMFASDGNQVDIRVADTETPDGGWESVAVAGSAKIVNHHWRRNTATVDVNLPTNPAEKTLYYTIWKDGRDVTADHRVGTDACGPGTGLVGDVPSSGNYVGRLPQLTAPYKLCGLSCHSLLAGLQERTDEGWRITGQRGGWQFRDQPTFEAYKHLEDYDFQVMVWEDDVWYMELALYPPSTDDAYKIVTLSICGPTSRWQMMRHWNVINPGDHDYGMDDVKGPEQIVIRDKDGLGQDASYMRRNFQIVHHLITGAEEVDPRENPKKWRAWKMPNRDFTFVILDSRLWRSSQDVDMWDDQGWNEFKSLYGRTDPTRSLLGEEQFGWLQELISSDSSKLIGITGINGLHTVWTGTLYRESSSTNHPMNFSERDRVTADYAGWVKAGSDRVIELLGGRDGVVTVYGDVHNGCIMKNVEHRVIECSFGPIGRTGGRKLIPGFGPEMKDVDGRDVEVHSLYHQQFSSPDQAGHAKGAPVYWNFLEMEFDPAHKEPRIGMRVRNLVDPPAQEPRGGAALETVAGETGRVPSSRLPSIQTLPNADVYFTHTNGRSIRGTRSDAQGMVHVAGLVDVAPGTQVVVNAFDGEKSASQVVTCLEV